MDKPAIILGKKIVSRKETLEYARDKFGWKNCIIGISCYFGFWAWIWGRLTHRKVIYYCIDFYSPEISDGFFDSIFIWLAMQMDKFLIEHVDETWDISWRISEGRKSFDRYGTYVNHEIVPLSYPPSYFRFREIVDEDKLAFVGLVPYGLELLHDYNNLEWLGKDKLLPLDELLTKLSMCGIGLSMWSWKGNNYYGDPGKTKLYSACGLPVIMTDNTPYAEVIKKTLAGLVINYDRERLLWAIKEITNNYNFYKQNVKKTWKYINADEIFKHYHILE